jgi:hypothetical protein
MVRHTDVIYGRVQGSALLADQAGARHGRSARGRQVRHKFVRFKDRGHMGLTDEVLREAQLFIDEVERASK